MNPMLKFMASHPGRMIRALAGIMLIFWGLLGLSGSTALVVIAAGFLALAAGFFDFCLIAPVCGVSANGSRIRSDK